VSVTEQPETRTAAEEPIDFTTVRRVVADAEEMALAEVDRPALDQRQNLLTDVVRRLMREDYPDRRQSTFLVFRQAYRAVDSPMRPGPDDSDFLAYQQVKNLARIAGALADVLDPKPVIVWQPRTGAGLP
jgi:hypothetical protein